MDAEFLEANPFLNKLYILLYPQNVRSLLPPVDRGAEPGLDARRVHCSVCCRPLKTGIFVIGRQIDPSKHDHHVLRVCPRYCYEYSLVTPWTWVCKSSLAGRDVCSEIYQLGAQCREPSFVLCADCIHILPMFMGSRIAKGERGSESDIRSPDRLFEHLKRQFFRDPCNQAFNRKLEWPRHAFADEQHEWTFSPTEEEWICKQSWLQASSYRPIPSLPLYILSKLKPLTADSIKVVSILSIKNSAILPKVQPSSLLNLPRELIQEIADYLSLASVFSMRETCHRLAQSIALDQWFWYSRLMRKELFGFLLRHDSQDVVKEMQLKAISRGLLPNKMDWMLLIKSLSEFSSFTSTGCFHDAPPGFRNRRRVWKILETMEQSSIDGHDMQEMDRNED